MTVKKIFDEISGGDDLICEDDLRKWFLKEKIPIDFHVIWDIAAQADNEADGITLDEFEVAVEDLEDNNFCVILLEDYTFWLIFPALIAPFWAIANLFLEFGLWADILEQILYGFAAIALVALQLHKIHQEASVKHLVYEELTEDFDI